MQLQKKGHWSRARFWIQVLHQEHHRVSSPPEDLEIDESLVRGLWPGGQMIDHLEISEPLKLVALSHNLKAVSMTQWISMHPMSQRTSRMHCPHFSRLLWSLMQLYQTTQSCMQVLVSSAWQVTLHERSLATTGGLSLSSSSLMCCPDAVVSFPLLLSFSVLVQVLSTVWVPCVRTWSFASFSSSFNCEMKGHVCCKLL